MISNTTAHRFHLSAPMSRRAMLGSPGLLLAALGAVMAPDPRTTRPAPGPDRGRNDRTQRAD